MKSILIRDTTREERLRIVHQALWGACGIDCEFCSGCDNRGGGRIESIYQPYIDGEKVHDFTVETPDIFYANAEVDAKSGELIVKLVNFGEKDAPVNITLAEGSRYDWSKAKLTLLKGDALDENTKQEPEKVIPQTLPFTLSADGSYLAPANSLSIIRVK